MGTTPATFSGSSSYAADLQQAITHAVTIASLPITQLTDNVSLLQSQGNELATLQSKFGTLQTALTSLDSAANGGGLAASVSDSSVAAATLDSSAAISAGTYSLNVISAGAPTTTLSSPLLPTVADPSTTSISSSTSFTLMVDGTPVLVSPAKITLNALAQAINTSGAGVNATVVNIGTTLHPDYRLSLQSTTLGNVPIQLNDGAQDLLTTISTGTPAQYQVDGQPSTPISSNTRAITLAPGLTVNLFQAGATDVTVAQNATAAENALSSFVTAYNAAVDEINSNHGYNGGALTGQSSVLSVEQSLKDLTNFSTNSGSVQNLADLGLTFDGTGHLTFNQAQFSSVSAAHPNDVAAFLGSSSGTGFLKTASNILTSLDDPINGVFQTEMNTLQHQINTETKQITDDQSRVTALQNQMVAQMSAADSLIASLQSQVTYFTNLFADTQNALKNG